MISLPILAKEIPLKNIKVNNKDGEVIYTLTENQIISLANYIAEIQAENKKLEAKLEQAEKELKKAYENKNKENIFRRVGDGLKGAGLAALIIALAQGLD